MLCVERMRGGFLPTISEYEPRCPSIVVELCSSSNNQEVLDQDVPDCAYVRQPTQSRDTQLNSDKGSDKRSDKCNNIGSTKVRCLKEDAEQIISALQQRKPSNGSPSDIRNKTISPSWDSLPCSAYKQNETKDNQRDIRNTKINTNSSALPRITSPPTQSINTNDIRNKTIRAASHSDDGGNTARNLKPSLVIPRGLTSSSLLPACEPWREVVTVRIGDQVRIWAQDDKHLVVEASAHKIRQLDCDDDDDIDDDDDADSTNKPVKHLITIPDGISLDSLMATLSLEGQLIIKEIRQQKPSRGNIVVIPIEKNKKI